MITICVRMLFVTAAATVLMGVGGLFATPHNFPPVEGAGEYVASASGSVYHKPDCYHAQRIKKDKVALTKDEAEIIGLRPCKDCLKTHERQLLTPLERSRLASGFRPE